jgi:hypothetical protein
MNDSTDIERALSSWFEDGPTAMPDRVSTVVADRIGRTRQQRTWRLRGRPIDMNATFKIGAAIAAVVVIAIVGYNLLPQRAGVAGPGHRPRSARRRPRLRARCQTARLRQTLT